MITHARVTAILVANFIYKRIFFLFYSFYQFSWLSRNFNCFTCRSAISLWRLLVCAAKILLRFTMKQRQSGWSARSPSADWLNVSCKYKLKVCGLHLGNLVVVLWYEMMKERQKSAATSLEQKWWKRSPAAALSPRRPAEREREIGIIY